MQLFARCSFTSLCSSTSSCFSCAIFCSIAASVSLLIPLMAFISWSNCDGVMLELLELPPLAMNDGKKPQVKGNFRMDFNGRRTNQDYFAHLEYPREQQTHLLASFKFSTTDICSHLTPSCNISTCVHMQR